MLLVAGEAGVRSVFALAAGLPAVPNESALLLPSVLACWQALGLGQAKRDASNDDVVPGHQFSCIHYSTRYVLTLFVRNIRA